jgi:hypothetical protein
VKRRGFLGFLGGAAVAGPSAAKSIVASAPTTLGGHAALGVGLMAAPEPDAPGNLSGVGAAFRKMDRLAQIKRWISGEEEPEEDIYDVARVRQLMVDQRVNALHSVSGAARMRIARREMSKIERDKQKKYWWREMLHLEKGDSL